MTKILWTIRRWGVTLVVKAAIACGVAFYLGSLLPDPIDDYKYYAALGAFTVVGLVLAESVKESIQVFGAVAVGVTVALLVQTVSWTNSLTVALTVAISFMLALTRLFGVQRSWAPLAGLFVLATGGPDPEPMVLGYLIQLPLGAVIGVVVNAALFAPLGEEDLEPAANHALALLAEQLDSYADLLQAQRESADEDDEEGDEKKEHDADRRDDVVHQNVLQLEDAQARLRAAMTRARRAARGNPRAALHAERQADVMARAEAVNRCSAMLLAAGVVLAQSNAPHDERGAVVRRHAEEALRHTSDVLEDPDAAAERPDLLRTTEESIDRMLRQSATPTKEDTLDNVIFGALAVTLRDCVRTYARRIARVDLPNLDLPEREGR